MVINNIKFSPTLDCSLVSSPRTYVAVMFLVKKKHREPTVIASLKPVLTVIDDLPSNEIYFVILVTKMVAMVLEKTP